MKLQLPNPTPPLLLAVSGGRDSMALLHALLHHERKTELHVAHINHGLRADSHKDLEQIQKALKDWGHEELALHSITLSPPKTGNIENWARQERYRFLEESALKHGLSHIATAHHQDDDFESMLLHFFRGTRVKGLSGMLPERPLSQNPNAPVLLRPLLFTSRREIDDYVEKQEIPYLDDPSNQDPRFKRNFIRHELRSKIEHAFPNGPERWQKQKNYWLELQAHLEHEAKSFLETQLKEGKLERDPYRALPLPIRYTVLELWFKQSTGERVSDTQWLERWDEAILEWHGNHKTEWGKKHFLCIEKNSVCLTKH